MDNEASCSDQLKRFSGIRERSDRNKNVRRQAPRSTKKATWELRGLCSFFIRIVPPDVKNHTENQCCHDEGNASLIYHERLEWHQPNVGNIPKQVHSTGRISEKPKHEIQATCNQGNCANGIPETSWVFCVSHVVPPCNELSLYIL